MSKGPVPNKPRGLEAMKANAEGNRRIDAQLGRDRDHLHPLFAHRRFSKRTIVAMVDRLEITQGGK